MRVPKFGKTGRFEKDSTRRFYSNAHLLTMEWGRHSPGPIYKIQSDFVQKTLPASPVRIKKRQASHNQRACADGEPGDHITAWAHTESNPLYPYKNAPKQGPRLARRYRNKHSLRNPKLKSKNPLNSKIPLQWKPRTDAWNASTIPDRHNGITLSVVQSPFMEKNYKGP